MIATFPRIALALAFFLAVPGTVLADPPKRNIDELMHKSGLWVQIGQFQSQVRAGAADARAKEAAGAKGAVMSDAEFARVVAALDHAFAPERMRRIVEKGLAETLSVDDEKEALAWLSSPLGARITQIEVAAGEDEPMMKAMNESQQYFESLPKERADRFVRFAVSNKSGESGASLMIDMTTAIAYGIAVSIPNGDEGQVKVLRRKLESQRPQLVAALNQRSSYILAYTYRDLGDDEVDRYVAFVESPAGQRLNDAVIKVLVQAFEQASLEIGRNMGAAMPKEPGRNS
jgi:Uncharacterized protein conserved in bacteria (DUF2059)